MIRGPQPETVRDYALLVERDGTWHTVCEVQGNYQRLCAHDIPEQPADAIRLTVTATNGAPDARLFEFRAYG